MTHFTNMLDGKSVDSDTHFNSYNPATGEILGHVALSSEAQVSEAVRSARTAQHSWAALRDDDRKSALMKVADIIRDNSEYLANWVTKEQGKPLGGVGPAEIPGSRFELFGCEAWTRVPASLDLPVELVFEDETRSDEIHRKPHGVIAAIAPWNWPLLIAIWQIVPSLRVGNTVVIKPSEFTSISTLELVRLISAALPPGVLNTVSGAGDVGTLLVDHPDVDKIMFTGSVATGKKIAESAARRLIPTTLELGGNDAAIVLPDADPKSIAAGLFWGAFNNMGQTCACIKRLYVHEDIHDAIVAELKHLAEASPMGDGQKPGVAMGPIQNKRQYEKVIDLVDDARRSGGQIICGGGPLGGPGFFYPVTIVTGLQEGDRLVDEEQFGPVLPVIRYKDIKDAVAKANRSAVGLGASVWSRDLEKAKSVATGIEAGTVWINQHGAIHPMVPFGGVKSSGWGVEFGMEGLKAVTRPQVISVRRG